MDMRVFWAVLAALGVAGLAVLGYQRYRDYQAVQALNEFAASIPRYTQADAWASQRQPDPRMAAEVAARRAEHASLRLDETCLGGTVVRVSGNSYTQVLGADGRPEACAGRTRVQAH
jgi:hypothetical protein